MQQNATPNDSNTFIPSLEEFEEWPPEKLHAVLSEKTVVLSTGGTSRWHFLEHGGLSAGYNHPDQFREYGRRIIQRTIEMADMIFDDGVQTLLIVGFGGGQAERNTEYAENLKWAYEMLMDHETKKLYLEKQIDVLFRGNWQDMLSRLEAGDLTNQIQEIEKQTNKESARRLLIWYVSDEVIPSSLIPLVAESISQTGRVPARAELCEAYYGRAIEYVDIFIGNNKSNVKDVSPPLMTLGDLYFTVSPIPYLSQKIWRRIAYDHLFARKGHYRDYDAMKPEDLENLRAYYKANQDVVLGLGDYHPSTQTWRPASGPRS